MLEQGEDKPVFIRGWPNYARDPDKDIIPLCKEADEPYFSVLIGRELGIPVVVYRARYPRGLSWHDEPGIWVSKYGLFFVLWLDRDDFIKDYEGQENKPYLAREWSVGRSPQIETLIG